VGTLEPLRSPLTPEPLVQLVPRVEVRYILISGRS
jgi:hypothetical protein